MKDPDRALTKWGVGTPVIRGPSTIEVSEQSHGTLGLHLVNNFIKVLGECRNCAVTRQGESQVHFPEIVPRREVREHVRYAGLAVQPRLAQNVRPDHLQHPVDAVNGWLLLRIAQSHRKREEGILDKLEREAYTGTIAHGHTGMYVTW